MEKVKHREDKNGSASRCKGRLEGLFGDACISRHWAHYKQMAQPCCHLIFHRKLFCLKCARVWSIRASWLCVHHRICLLVWPALFKTPSDGGLRANKSFGLLESQLSCRFYFHILWKKSNDFVPLDVLQRSDDLRNMTVPLLSKSILHMYVPVSRKTITSRTLTKLSNIRTPKYTRIPVQNGCERKNKSSSLWRHFRSSCPTSQGQ